MGSKKNSISDCEFYSEFHSKEPPVKFNVELPRHPLNFPIESTYLSMMNFPISEEKLELNSDIGWVLAQTPR